MEHKPHTIQTISHHTILDNSAISLKINVTTSPQQTTANDNRNTISHRQHSTALYQQEMDIMGFPQWFCFSKDDCGDFRFLDQQVGSWEDATSSQLHYRNEVRGRAAAPGIRDQQQTESVHPSRHLHGRGAGAGSLGCDWWVAGAPWTAPRVSTPHAQ